MVFNFLKPSIVAIATIAMSNVIRVRAYDLTNIFGHSSSSKEPELKDFFQSDPDAYDKYEMFDAVLPTMIESAILSGEIGQYINATKVHSSLFSSSKKSSRRRRHLEETTNETLQTNETVQTLRNCNEMIFRFTAEEVKQLVKDYIAVLGGFSDSGIPPAISGFVDRRFKLGIEAHKICASCSEFQESYGGMGDNTYGNDFDSYCGADKYGSDANVSGLLYIPVDNDGYLRKTSNLALWNRWIEFYAKEVPSEQFLANGVWETTQEELENRGFSPVGLLTSGIGTVSLLPDYIGYGESYKYAKGPSIKAMYQKGIVPLVLKLRDSYLSEVTDGLTSLSNYVVTSGYSEGGMPAIVSGSALSELGFRPKTQAGGTPINHISKTGLPSIYLKTGIRDFILGWAAVYSSVNPDIVNTNTGQDFLSEEWRDEIVAWFSGDQLDYTEKNISESIIEGDAYFDYFNPNVHEMLTAVLEDDSIKEVCKLSEVGKTDKFCEALKASDLQDEVRNTRHKTNLCWAKEDQNFDFTANVPPFFQRVLNPNLRVLSIPSNLPGGDTEFSDVHTVAGGYCLALMAVNFFLPFQGRFL